ETGVIIGTLPYMSPEQVKGESLDARSDIFGFGAVLYEMITGRQPFAAKSAAETISAILIREPPPISRDSITVPSTLTQIVGKCLEKDRERRYQAAADVAQDLKNACRGCESRPESLSNEESTQELPKLITRRPRSSFLSTSPRRAVLATGFLL